MLLPAWCWCNQDADLFFFGEKCTSNESITSLIGWTTKSEHCGYSGKASIGFKIMLFTWGVLEVHWTIWSISPRPYRLWIHCNQRNGFRGRMRASARQDQSEHEVLTSACRYNLPTVSPLLDSANRQTCLAVSAWRRSKKHCDKA